jgi:hypothetical protein
VAEKTSFRWTLDERTFSEPAEAFREVVEFGLLFGLRR